MSLRLPGPGVEELAEAARAVREESAERLVPRRLSAVRVDVEARAEEAGPGDAASAVVAIKVEGADACDWTWEGASAFGLVEGLAGVRERLMRDPPPEDWVRWRGEVLEVDEANAVVFVALRDPAQVPGRGAFWVSPFDHQEAMDLVYTADAYAAVRERLGPRLRASRGGIHPRVPEPEEAVRSGALSELSGWWGRGWSVLWGPPGTGKTHTTGLQVAAALRDPSERVLVLSTTNRATDEVALSIGGALIEEAVAARSGATEEIDLAGAVAGVCRPGRGARRTDFERAGLASMLRGADEATAAEIEALQEAIASEREAAERARSRLRISRLAARPGGGDVFLDPCVRAVVATSAAGSAQLKRERVREMIEDDDAPFTTVVIDEAGLLSRASVAALSLLAARRVVLVGDPRQLSPIATRARLLPTREQRWLRSSALSHLDDPADAPRGVHVLKEQRRMHPEVCRVVSGYRYGGFLETAPETAARASKLPSPLAEHGRVVWWVLDAEDVPLARMRAERGPGGRSWVRPVTMDLLGRLIDGCGLHDKHGLFVSPYRAQADAVSAWLRVRGSTSWSASTVHRQQGSQADVVVFDTVHAGSAGFPAEEWRRLVNVALSRAREAVVVLASRDEMAQPYLAALRQTLTASRLRPGDPPLWEAVEADRVSESRAAYAVDDAAHADTLGGQIARRRASSPVLSAEQQRLVDLPLDGKPRLVRGVAGSGKSLVLCHWLVKTVLRFGREGWPDAGSQVWAVFANRALEPMLRSGVEQAWFERARADGGLFGQEAFPWERTQLLHVRDVLRDLLPGGSGRLGKDDFEHDAAAEWLLARNGGVDGDAASGLPRCEALFIDEAQDMSPATLRLLLAMVRATDPEDAGRRAAHVFYDNAQNVYDRKPPVWSHLGLDVRGRSTVMTESFRGTRPVAELAINVRERLADAAGRTDLKEFVRRRLVVLEEREGERWIGVRFNDREGPPPRLRTLATRTLELAAVAKHLRWLLVDERVPAADVVLLYNGAAVSAEAEALLGPAMRAIGIELSRQTGRGFERRENTLLLTTAQSFKGHEAEVVVILGLDGFVARSRGPLADSLYVAMTRARSVLMMYGLEEATGAAGRVIDTVRACCEAMNQPRPSDGSRSRLRHAGGKSPRPTPAAGGDLDQGPNMSLAIRKSDR
ncbi:hypothetical protein PSMK_25580 [Phycisphaera mikurensis NBRC 102666]|uniref:Uncharacterized protein n=1 Tax=Phycisphaera mikurensis (strain NBRC 102666 / KCTC 22515 / FYK2301M01) TaxID=1142394 RepID=I0IHH9_PHYMF|nr:hypothetical protein PSMK_25580 [Phycisphaera mikurensis NBRC 102666]